MITSVNLAVLDALSSGHELTLDELVADTGYSRTHLYRALREDFESGESRTGNLPSESEYSALKAQYVGA